MNLLQSKWLGILKRINANRYGLFYFRNDDFKIKDVLLINKKPVKLMLANANSEEFTAICLNDIYKLSLIKKKLGDVMTIVDIGANNGLFLIAARQQFKKSRITCYEPNNNLKDVLRYNCEKLNAAVFFEAVTLNDCMLELNLFESDLATTVSLSEKGTIKGTSFNTVVARGNGKIDILKIDCEGGEWEILKDVQTLSKVRAISMEYHLNEKDGKTLKALHELLSRSEFEIIHHLPLPAQQGILVAINKN